MFTIEGYKKTVFTLVKESGVKATDEHGNARLEICNTLNDGKRCQYLGEVEPLPGLVCEGCTRCGCPSETKPFMIRAFGKNVVCKHPDGNMWAPIDKQFLND